MKQTLSAYNQVRTGLVLIPMLLLSGCAPINWIKDKLNTNKQRTNEATGSVEDIKILNDGSTVLATMQGQPIVTETSLNAELEKLMEERPQIRQMLPMMPNLKYDFLKGLVSQKVVDRYITLNNIDSTQEYQKELAQAINSLKLVLNAKYFNQKFPVTISDSEAQKFYNENKTQMKELLISNGGVQTFGISTSSQDEAKKIADAARGKDLGQVAGSLGKKANFHDFKLVHKDSVGIDSALKAKVVSIKKFPTTEVVKASDGTFWVITVTSAQEPKYRPFEQVKDGIRAYLENEKRMEKMTAEIERLSKEYNIVINDEYFKNATDAGKDEKSAEPRMAQAEQVEPAATAAHVA